MDCYPNNTAAQHTTKLPRNINLEGDWEVALTEISVPVSMSNVLKDTCMVYLKRGSRIDTHTVMPGYYRNTEDLLDFLSKGVADRGIALTMAEGKVVVAIASDSELPPFSSEETGIPAAFRLPCGRTYCITWNRLDGENVETLFVYCNGLYLRS